MPKEVQAKGGAFDKPKAIRGGTLYLVSTPIGNLEDITLRALKVLSEVDLIAAEDTRHTKILFDRYAIRTPKVAYHEFNKERKTPELIRELKSGKSVAVVSDAGTPGISDPGFHLVRAAIEEGIPVVPIPGPTALVAALVASGLPSHRFSFEGFLPVKKGRQKRLEQLKGEERTLIFYESPYRVLRTLQDLLTHFGDRRVVVAREITKHFEDYYRGTLAGALKDFSERKPRGEFVIIVEGQRHEMPSGSEKGA